jgi:hypothetical protein
VLELLGTYTDSNPYSNVNPNITSKISDTKREASNITNPNPNSNPSSFITVSLRRTFLKLPDLPDDSESNFEMRKYDPKSGFNSLSYKNESALLSESRDSHFITRHKLDTMNGLESVKIDERKEEKKEEKREESDVEKEEVENNKQGKVRKKGKEGKEEKKEWKRNTRGTPTSRDVQEVFYQNEKGENSWKEKKLIDTIDGAPEESDSDPLQLLYLIDFYTPTPVREALVEGVSWWDEAFQYAGFPKGTFQAKVADKDFDPYNISSPSVHFVEWIDRLGLGLRLGLPSGLVLGSGSV